MMQPRYLPMRYENTIYHTNMGWYCLLGGSGIEEEHFFVLPARQQNTLLLLIPFRELKLTRMMFVGVHTFLGQDVPDLYSTICWSRAQDMRLKFVQVDGYDWISLTSSFEFLYCMRKKKYTLLGYLNFLTFLLLISTSPPRMTDGSSTLTISRFHISISGRNEDTIT